MFEGQEPFLEPDFAPRELPTSDSNVTLKTGKPVEEWRRQKRQTKKRVCSDCNIQQKAHLKSLDIC